MKQSFSGGVEIFFVGSSSKTDIRSGKMRRYVLKIFTSMTLCCLFIPPKDASGEVGRERNLVYLSVTQP